MQWSLEKIYKEQVNGEIPPRKHLKVIGEATYDEVIALLKDMNERGLLDDEVELAYIKRYLTKRPYEKGLLEYLKNKNLNEGTIVEGNVQEIIISILSKNKDLETFDKYINDPKPFESVIKRTGNLVEVISAVSGIKKETAAELVNIKGSESGRGVGKGEIAMATIFSDIKMAAGKGDLDWGGRYLEFSNAAYPEVTINIQDDLDLTNPQEVRKALEKVMVSNYASREGVDWFIMINTGKTRFYGRYFVFKTEEISKYIDDKTLKLGVISTDNLDPSLGTI